MCVSEVEESDDGAFDAGCAGEGPARSLRYKSEWRGERKELDMPKKGSYRSDVISNRGKDRRSDNIFLRVSNRAQAQHKRRRETGGTRLQKKGTGKKGKGPRSETREFREILALRGQGTPRECWWGTNLLRLSYRDDTKGKGRD